VQGAQGEPGARGERGLPGPQGQPGPQGDPGLLPEVLLWAPGTYTRAAAVAHRGGTWQAKCDTHEEPGAGGEWRCIARGIDTMNVEATGPRELTLCLRMTDGTELRGAFDHRVPVHLGKWLAERTYAFNDEVAWEGCTWRMTEAQSMGQEPSKSSAWLLVAKQGKRGADGTPGPRGLAGARGEKGEQGQRGERGDAGPQGKTGLFGVWQKAYRAGRLYEKGAVVSYHGYLWLATESTDAVPTAGQTAWEPLLGGQA
jgi:hypothetical protein